MILGGPDDVYDDVDNFGEDDAIAEAHGKGQLEYVPVVDCQPPEPPTSPPVDHMAAMDQNMVRIPQRDGTERVYLRQPELGEDVYVGTNGYKFKLMRSLKGKFYMHSLARQAQPVGAKPLPQLTPFEMARHAIVQRNSSLVSALATELLAMQASLATEPLSPSPPVPVESIDVSGWTEFGNFFDKPCIASTLHQFDIRDSDRKVVPNTPDYLYWKQEKDCTEEEKALKEERRHRIVIAVSYLSVFATDREDAVKALRRDLLKIHNNPELTAHSFLAKPCVAAVFDMPRIGEEPNAVAHFRLTVGPEPAIQGYVAFCYLTLSGTFANDAEEREYFAGNGYPEHICTGVRPFGLPSEFEAFTGIRIARQEGQIGVRDADL